MAPSRIEEPEVDEVDGVPYHLDVVAKKDLVKQLTAPVWASNIDQRTVECVRGLVLDCCQQWGIGHGGSALGMAAIATALWRHKLRFDPAEPDWFDRDRFVMSNGHVALLQYIMLHLSGYKVWDMDQLKGYCHPTALNFTNLCKTPKIFGLSHPEIEFDGLDVSTGPLGQGVANAVGMAMANMHLRERFNRDGFKVVQGKVYATTGDACLQEGPALEAISLAGRMQLDNLILIYDNNAVQSDGGIELTFDEDVNAKMRACGWYVIEIPDGTRNVQAILTALEHADAHVGRPVFININTIIGHGTSLAGTCKAHHAAFGEDNVRKCKQSWGYDGEKTHVIPSDVREYWSHVPKKGKQAREAHEALLEKYTKRFPRLAEEFRQVTHGELGKEWKQELLSMKAKEGKTPVRQSSGMVFDSLWKKLLLFGGSADLSEPNNVLREPKEAFGPVDKGGVAHRSYRGRFVHFGTREHGMSAIANGIAAYSARSEHGDRGQAFIPVTATFSMFQLYGAAAIRMGALMKLKVIHIGTHDSIAEGACGPTHQPVELLNLWRSMPVLLYIRPCDAEEAIGAWLMAIEHDGPTVLGLNRGAVPLQKGTDRIKMQKGAYVIEEDDKAKVTLVATGSDIAATADAAKLLREAGMGARVVSMPSMRRFEEQDQKYIQSVIPRDGRPVVSVEAMSMHGWAKWATASIGLTRFGTTVHADAVSEYWQITPEHIARRVKTYLGEIEGQNALLTHWRAI